VTHQRVVVIQEFAGVLMRKVSLEGPVHCVTRYGILAAAVPVPVFELTSFIVVDVGHTPAS
jgi:hypothetical protein